METTAPLKFDHPGLATIASRSEERLVLQNDIGTTDAHVLVVHVTDLEVTVIYTDVHIERAQFFESLLSDRPVEWQDLRARRAPGLTEGDAYYLCVGVHKASDLGSLADFLHFLGSRLVFLIDWNKARKRLRAFLPKKDVIGLLRWAADQDHGHRARLELGGDQLIYEAIEYAAKAPLHYGQPLWEVLGREEAQRYLQFAIKAAAEGLLAGRSERMIRDEIKAELVNYFETVEERLLALAADHVALLFDLADLVAAELARSAAFGWGEGTVAAKRAKRWETVADELLRAVRSLVSRSPGTERFAELVSVADDAADELEEAAFLVSMLRTTGHAAGSYRPLAELGALAREASRELVRCVDAARDVHRGAARQDVHDLLTAVDALLRIEHQADETAREVTAKLLEGAPDFRALHLGTEIAGALEGSTDHLARCGLMLRDQALGQAGHP